MSEGSLFCNKCGNKVEPIIATQTVGGAIASIEPQELDITVSMQEEIEEPDFLSEVRSLIERGNGDEAVRVYRDNTGCSVADAVPSGTVSADDTWFMVLSIVAIVLGALFILIPFLQIGSIKNKRKKLKKEWDIT